MRFLICGIALGATLAVATPSLAAEKVGIAVCDDFLDKYEVCVKDKVPATQRASYSDQVNQLRSTWKQMITSNPQTKAELEGACKQMMESMKAALSGSYGCSF